MKRDSIGLWTGHECPVTIIGNWRDLPVSRMSGSQKWTIPTI